MNEDRQTIRLVRQLLDESAQQIAPHVQTRLDEAITKALQARTHCAEKNLAQEETGGFVQLCIRALSGWFNRPALSLAVSAALVLVSVAGVVKFGLDYQQANDTATADLDAAILSDDLPPDAYLDSGFINFTRRKPEPMQQLPADETIDKWIESVPVDDRSAI